MSLPPSPVTPGASVREAHKAVVVARVKRQRERWDAGRTPRNPAASAAVPPADAAAAVAAAVQTVPPAGDFPRSVTLQLITRHPVLAVAGIGLLMAMGPTRLLRTASWLLPALMRRY